MQANFTFANFPRIRLTPWRLPAMEVSTSTKTSQSLSVLETHDYYFYAKMSALERLKLILGSTKNLLFYGWGTNAHGLVNCGFDGDCISGDKIYSVNTATIRIITSRENRSEPSSKKILYCLEDLEEKVRHPFLARCLDPTWKTDLCLSECSNRRPIK